MLNTLEIIFVGLMNVTQSTCSKLASDRIKTNEVLSFNVLKSGSAVLFMLLFFGARLDINTETAVYAALYGSFLLFSMICGYLALMAGNMAITSLIVSYSIVIPYLFGALFLKEKVGFLQVIGFLLLLVSMFLLKKKSGDRVYGKNWGLYTLITFLCNGACSIIQKLHQRDFPGQYNKEFNVISLAVIFSVLLVAVIVRGVRGGGYCRMAFTKFAVPAGVLTAASNSLTLYLSAIVNATILFPLITVSSALFNCIASWAVFGDKLNPRQLFAIALGVGSILLIRL